MVQNQFRTHKRQCLLDNPLHTVMQLFWSKTHSRKPQGVVETKNTKIHHLIFPFLFYLKTTGLEKHVYQNWIFPKTKWKQSITEKKQLNVQHTRQIDFFPRIHINRAQLDWFFNFRGCYQYFVYSSEHGSFFTKVLAACKRRNLFSFEIRSRLKMSTTLEILGRRYPIFSFTARSRPPWLHCWFLTFSISLLALNLKQKRNSCSLPSHTWFEGFNGCNFEVWLLLRDRAWLWKLLLH